jgi:hypothetical protein
VGCADTEPVPLIPALPCFALTPAKRLEPSEESDVSAYWVKVPCTTKLPEADCALSATLIRVLVDVEEPDPSSSELENFRLIPTEASVPAPERPAEPAPVLLLTAVSEPDAVNVEKALCKPELAAIREPDPERLVEPTRVRPATEVSVPEPESAALPTTRFSVIRLSEASVTRKSPLDVKPVSDPLQRLVYLSQKVQHYLQRDFL